jgi:pyruvate dehydrogenase (quinone)/pyruvate oxidase
MSDLAQIPVNAAPHTVAEVILEQLRLWGVKRIYGVVGDSIFGLLDAIARQHAIQFIAVRHEQVAAMMASAEAKLTGGLGVCAAQTGPGLCNLLSGLGDAGGDRVPVLAITGQVPLSKLGTHYKQYLNQQELVSPIASYSTLLAHPDAVVDVLTCALHQSLAHGAVSHLSIPADVFSLATTVRPRPKISVSRLVPDRESLQHAINLLRSADRPMILAGTGSRPAAKSLAQLAQSWGAGIALSYGAVGMLPDDHPHLLGGLGEGGNPLAAGVFVQADVVLAVGTSWWPEGYVPTGARIVQIDKRAANLGRGIPCEIGLACEAEAAIPLILAEMQGHSGETDWMRHVREVIQIWRRQNELEGREPGSPVPPPAIVRAIEQCAAENAIITLDTGDSTVWFLRNFRAKGQIVLLSRHWRTMGFGLPAALAAKISTPERQVIAVVGDGGLGMVLADLLTASQYGLPVVVVLFRNGSLQMERDKMVEKGYIPEGTIMRMPDFVSVAQACGWLAYRVESAAELTEVLRRAFDSASPVLVDVNTAPVAHPDFR